MNKKPPVASLRTGLSKLNSYADFTKILSDFDLKINDLIEYGTLRSYQLKFIKKTFKGHENDKKFWSEFKKSYTEHYVLIHVPTIVAFNNKCCNVC